MERWRELHSVAWLIAALDLTDPKDASTAELLKAAEKVPVASPGCISVRYHALRTMARGKEQEAARHELDSWLSRPESESPHGTRNLFNDERQRLSTSLADFLTHAAEVPAQIGLDMDGSDLAGDDEQALTESAKNDKGKAFFNDYSAQILAQRMPLELLVESAKSPTLPVVSGKSICIDSKGSPTGVLRKNIIRPHAAISSSQYSWCSPPRTSLTRIRQAAGNSCR